MVDAEAALAFLRIAQPGGPWVLDTAKGGRARLHVRATDDAAVRAFVEDTAGRDVYALLGIAADGVTGQPEKSQMLGSRLLWVDLDPRAGEPLAAERERIEASLRRPPSGAPPPSLVVDSGRGLWAFWLLAEPCMDTALVERHNQTLAILFGAIADACHNCNRIGRLPGTVNTKTGAVARMRPDLSRPDARYTLAEMPAPAVAREAPTLRPAVGPAVGVDDLPAFLARHALPDRVGVIVNQGRVPGEIKPNDNSRSAWLHDAMCAMARANVPAEKMLGILLDRDFGISESVYRTADGRNVPSPEKYARRQVERAYEAVAEQPEPELAELNKRHAVLMQQGGKARVLCWERSELDHGRAVAVLQTFEDFRNRYMNRSVAVQTDKGVTQRPMGDWWLKHARRRQFLALRFLPDEPAEVDGYLNLWRGFGVEPRPGDWPLMRQHIRAVLAAGDAAAASYIERWAAWAVQNPGEPADVALVFQGGRGTGKGFFARALKRLFGQHGLQVTSPAQLTGRFNAHMQDCCLLFADEAIAPGDKAAESVLKALITEPELIIEGKGVNAIQARNRLHIVMVSNEEWVVPAGHDERRFAVFRASDARRGDHDYFAALNHELDAGGLAAMLHDLLHLDLGGWHPRRGVPKTEALQRQKDLSLGPAEQFILGILESGEIPATRAPGPAFAFLSNDEGTAPGLYTAMRRASPRLRDWSAQKLGVLLKEWGCTHHHTGRARGWAFPPLTEMRARWDVRFGERAWPEPAHWAEVTNARSAF